MNSEKKKKNLLKLIFTGGRGLDRPYFDSQTTTYGRSSVQASNYGNSGGQYGSYGTSGVQAGNYGTSNYGTSSYGGNNQVGSYGSQGYSGQGGSYGNQGYSGQFMGRYWGAMKWITSKDILVNT